jgi:hypothetical protein
VQYMLPCQHVYREVLPCHPLVFVGLVPMSDLVFFPRFSFSSDQVMHNANSYFYFISRPVNDWC